MNELMLMGMLRRRNVRAVAVMLQVTAEELRLALKRLKICPEPDPAPLPERTTWRPEIDEAFPRLRALGRSAQDAAADIERAIRRAVREGTMHINAGGELIRDWDPEILVFDDLEAARYACGAASFPAAGIGAPQIRERLYWVADAESGEERRPWEHLSREGGAPGGRGADDAWSDFEWLECSDGCQRPTRPSLLPLAPRSPAHLERLRGYGNAIGVPAASAFIAAYLDASSAGPVAVPDAALA
jgi:hypothetical protein